MELNIQPGQKALITTNAWFYGPDGRQYHAVFGTVKAIRADEETLGIKSNRNSTNWYVEIGNMTIAGCQVHYAIRCETCNTGETEAWTSDAANGVRVFRRPSSIYNADADVREG
jgi:hypothetical protein